MLPPILLKLYAVPIDSGSRAVMLFFEQLGVKFQLCKFDENATSELGHLPSGWPILRDNTFYVFEPYDTFITNQICQQFSFFIFFSNTEAQY